MNHIACSLKDIHVFLINSNISASNSWYIQSFLEVQMEYLTLAVVTPVS